MTTLTIIIQIGQIYVVGAGLFIPYRLAKWWWINGRLCLAHRAEKRHFRNVRKVSRLLWLFVRAVRGLFKLLLWPAFVKECKECVAESRRIT